jgi:hypothetical protein
MRLMTHGTQPLARRDDTIKWLLHPALHANSHSTALVIEVLFAYKDLGALFLKASLHQDVYLIKACTLVAVCAICTGPAEGARGCMHEIERGGPYTAPSQPHHTVGGRL